MKVSSPSQPLPELPKNIPPPPVISPTNPGTKPGAKTAATPSWITTAKPNGSMAGTKTLTGQ